MSWLRYGAILASAVLFALYGRVELPWSCLGWVALVPWLASLDRESRMPAVLGSGVVMSMAFTVGMFAWLADAVARYAGLPSWLSYALLALAAPLLQPQFVAFACVRRVLRSRGADGFAASAAAAFVWVGTEWIVPRLLGDTIGHGLYPWATLRQGADLTGAPGLTFVLVLVNERLYAAMRLWRSSMPRSLAAFATAVAAVGLLAGYGVLRLHSLARSEPSAAPLTAVLVQASLHDYDGLRARLGTWEAVNHILAAHTRLSREAIDRATDADPVELVVWPETVYPTTFGTPKSDAGAEVDAEIEKFVERTNVALLFGTYDRDADGEYNAAVLLAPGARGPPTDVYRKRRPFPLTEAVPPWLDSPSLRRRLPWLGTWKPGDGASLVTLRRSRGGSVVLAPLICLDAVDPDLALDAARRGGQVLVTLSNDGWFAHGGGARLHLTVSAFRSIETRLPQLRATNTGISAVIRPDGEIVARAAVGRSTALSARILPAGSESTLMTRWGDWFGPVSCFLAVVFALLALRLRPSVIGA